MSDGKWLRFADLKARGLFTNRVSLANRIRKNGFPVGRLIGPNSRAWLESEVDAWLASQPTAPRAGNQPPRPRGRPRKNTTAIEREAQPPE